MACHVSLPEPNRERGHEQLAVIKEQTSTKTKRYVADKLCISESMMGLLMRGHRSWTPKYLKLLAEEFEIDTTTQTIMHRLAAKAAGYVLV